jgi:hypothetical protein
MEDITRKEGLTSYLDRSVNKRKKLWNVNQNEIEATQTVQFIRQFFLRDNRNPNNITRNVLTIL